jgi:NAD(P)-dependent dehydrogenase (short-subunit alcohol dehydrogenase family)
MVACSKSKLLLLHFKYLLSEYLKDAGIKVNAFAHGAIASNLGVYKIFPSFVKWILFRMVIRNVILPKDYAKQILSII